MGSGGKKKTTMAKFARENRLRERRLIKQAKKDARKLASSDDPDGAAQSWLGQAMTPDSVPATLEAAVQQPAAVDRKDAEDQDTPHSTAHQQPIGLAPVGGEDPPSGMSA